MDELPEFLSRRRPTPKRPLMGMTMLVVEDSRFASEALRLMCLRSGARIRRADCLETAARHLKVYRPSAVIIDMGLPDGSGADLIRDLAQARPRVGVILGTSGDDGAEALALQAGADGFLAKPLQSLGAFQETVLSALPVTEHPAGPRPVEQEQVEPDISAYHDDISQIADLLANRQDGPTLAYAAQFLNGIAVSAEDDQLAHAAHDLSQTEPGQGRRRAQAARIVQMVADRLERRVAI